MPVLRDKTGRFLPGNASSGGRPKIPEEVKEATRAACPEAVQLLVKIMRDEKQKTAYRLDAAKTLLDRGYGKPMQMQDISVDMAGSLDLEAQVRRVYLEMKARQDDGDAEQDI